ncbi:hypothetical protein CVT24_007514 [Panaeolus cyanescens]|uniref:Uncharacterized protein n=1 Tax=Panaeolus cyanescens TaxID=181874 RepID=A0A409YWI0_9AGAR|nr:hypothetical protein CVT24_007514 [Panaeolus cyanescens]
MDDSVIDPVLLALNPEARNLAVPVEPATHTSELLDDKEPEKEDDEDLETTVGEAGGTVYTLEQQDKIISEEVWKLVLDRRAKYKADKGTSKAYPRHVKRYEEWWDENEKKRVLKEAEAGNVWTARPAHPITAEKAALFLDYESKRPKKSRDGKDIPNTRVGRSSIQQTISALQNYRSDHQRDEDYRNCPESHISLRDNIEIREIERSAKADEPERQKESQEMKAQGVANQTFTTDELILMSNDHLTNPNGRAKVNIHSSIRDRAMLLFTTAMALRGDDTRSILLSDILIRDVPLPDIGLDHSVKVSLSQLAQLCTADINY